MGKRGPQPLPTALKMARGTHRRDRHGDPAAEPQIPAAVIGEPPCSLGEHGRREWLTTGPILVAAGLLTKADVAPFIRYCRAHDEEAAAIAIIEKEGEDITTVKGFVCQHPAVNRRFKWIGVMERFEARFGMAASNRGGMQVSQKQKTVPSRVRA